MKDSFEKMMLDSMGVEYANAVLGLFEKVSWTFPILAFVGGIFGALLGFLVLDKHFRKAGIV